MARKKETRKLFSGFSTGLKDETVHTVLSIVFAVVGVFLLFAAFERAGLAGQYVYGGFEALLGVGFFLLPVLLFLLALALFHSIRPHLAFPVTIGAVVFLFSGLGLIELLFEDDTAGMVGRMIASPLVLLFDRIVSIILLIAFLLISLLMIFDTRPRGEHFAFLRKAFTLPKWGGKKAPGSDEDVEEDDGDEYEEAEGDEEIEEPDTSEPEPEKASPKPALFSRNKAEKKTEEAVMEEELSSAPQFNAASFDETFTPPPLSLLEKDRGKPGSGDLKANMNIIKRTLHNFGIVVEMDEVSVGPSVTRYALKPAEGVKLSRILGLQNELALALAAHPVRIEAPIPGTSLVGIEIPNRAKSTVGLASLLSAREYTNSPKPLLTTLGKGISGKATFADLAKMPHLLIAGTTGSGKSVFVHTLINSLLFRNSPSNLRFIMVDPKRVELTLYNGIPHLLTPVITDPKKAILALKWAAKEMTRRYDILEGEAVRDIGSYHENVLKPELKRLETARKKMKEGDEEPKLAIDRMPYIVIMIDELADIMQAYPKELESAIVRLAQMSRAVGIHLVLSTQRPSVNVITGLIKANIPSRVALQVASQIDSRTILDTNGAEKLLGAGDLLFMSGEMATPRRLQSAFLSETELKKVVKYLKKEYEGELPDEINLAGDNKKDALFDAVLEEESSEDEDDLYEEARELVVRTGKASTSYLQRKLGIGYSRAARIIDILEERGVVGPANGSKPREVLERVNEEEYAEE